MRELAKHLLQKSPWLWRYVNYQAREALKFQFVQHFQRRTNYTYTQFWRLPTQYDALCGPVIDFLAPEARSQPLRFIDVGCSTGAEVYSIISVLTRRHPKLAFSVLGIDINPDVIAEAAQAVYAHDEVYLNRLMTEEFVQATFDREGEKYRVKAEFRERATFAVHDILDTNIADALGQWDIVFAQNILMNLPYRAARRAFHHISLLMADRSILFMDGVDPTMRNQITEQYTLEPLDYEIEKIHQEALVERGFGYPNKHWGLEPFDGTRPDWKRRYATIFLKQPQE